MCNSTTVWCSQADRELYYMNVWLAHTKQTYTTYASFYQRVQIKKVTRFFFYGDVFAYAISSSTQETLTCMHVY